MAFRNVLHFILFVWFLEFLWIIFHKTFYSLTWFAMRTIFFIGVSSIKSLSRISQFVLSSLCSILGSLMHKGEQLYIGGTSEKAGSLAYSLNNKTISSQELQNGSHRLVLCYISKRKGKSSEEVNQSEEQSDSDVESDDDSSEFEEIAVQDEVDESSANVQKRKSVELPVSRVKRHKSEENKATVFSSESNSGIREQPTEMSILQSNLTSETCSSALRPDIVASSSSSNRQSTYPTEACFLLGNDQKVMAASSSVNQDTSASSTYNFEPEIRPPSSSSSGTVEYLGEFGYTDIDGLGHETDESNNSFNSQQEALKFLQESQNKPEGDKDINLDAAHEEQRASDSNTCPQLLVSDYASFNESDTNDEIAKSRILGSILAQKTSLNLSGLKEQSGGEKDKTVVKEYDKNQSAADSSSLLQEGELKSLDDGSDMAPGFEMIDDGPPYDPSDTRPHPEWVGANTTIGGPNEYDLNDRTKNSAEEISSIYDKVLNTNERLESHASDAGDVNIPSKEPELGENSFSSDNHLSKDQQTLPAFSSVSVKATGGPPVKKQPFTPPSEEETGPPRFEDMDFKSEEIEPLFEEIDFKSDDITPIIWADEIEGTADFRPSLQDQSPNATSSISEGSRTTQSPGTSKKDNYASRVNEIRDYKLGEDSQEPSAPEPEYVPDPNYKPYPSEAEGADNDFTKVRHAEAVPARHGHPKSDEAEARCRPHIAEVPPPGSCHPNVRSPESANSSDTPKSEYSSSSDSSDE